MEAVEVFSGVNCAGTPDVLAIYNVTASCAENACSHIDFGNDTYYISRACNISDRFEHTKDVFGDFTYVVMETYDNKSCTSFGEADAFLASGSCEISSGFGDQSAITSLFSNGSAVVALYPNGACGGEPSLHFELDKAALSTGSCQQDLYRFYGSGSGSSSADITTRSDGQSNSGSSTIDALVVGSESGSSSTNVDDGSNGPGVSIGAIVGIAVGGLAIVFTIALLVANGLRRKLKMEEEDDNFNAFRSPLGGHKNDSLTAPGTLEPLWDDGNSGSVKPLSLFLGESWSHMRNARPPTRRSVPAIVRRRASLPE
ncbi:hypothetical protein PRIC2_014767 [Phytophthora ramorum]